MECNERSNHHLYFSSSTRGRLHVPSAVCWAMHSALCISARQLFFFNRTVRCKSHYHQNHGGVVFRTEVGHADGESASSATLATVQDTYWKNEQEESQGAIDRKIINSVVVLVKFHTRYLVVLNVPVLE